MYQKPVSEAVCLGQNLLMRIKSISPELNDKAAKSCQGNTNAPQTLSVRE